MKKLAYVVLLLPAVAGPVNHTEINPDERMSGLQTIQFYEQHVDHDPEKPDTNPLRELRNIYVSASSNMTSEDAKKFRAALDIGSKSGERFKLT